METTRRESGPPRLGLWDAVSIILGIIIGVGIFEIPAEIFEMAPGPWAALGVWLMGGVLALIGALCFAELASTYPRSGGEYVYLTRAYGPLVGFLFAWAQLAVIRPGSIAAVAYVFANYAAKLWALGDAATLALALGSVLVLTLINVLGVTLGKHTQNFLTALKVIGLGVIVVVGFGWGKPPAETAPMIFDGKAGWFATAMILVLWTYAGWHEAAYVAAEVKEGRRNIPLALILGTTAVTLIYVAVNAALWFALGFEGAHAKTAPAQVLRLAWGAAGERAISLLIMISALGAINGMIFTTARIYSEFGHDHRLFQPLSRWSRRFGTPARALVVQGAICVGLMLGVSLWVNLQIGGLEISGGSAAELRARLENLPLPPEEPPAPAIILHVGEGLNQMINVTAAVFWLFFLLTGIAVFVLRTKDDDLPRPFRVPAYPVLPLVFCLWCGYMAYGAIRFKPNESLIGLGILILGVAFYFLPKRLKRRAAPVPVEPPPTPVGVG